MLSSSKVFKSEDCIRTHLWAALLSDNVWYKNIYKQCLKRQCLITGIEDKQVICLNVWEKKIALELARGWRVAIEVKVAPVDIACCCGAVDLLLQLKGQHETRQVLIPSTPKPSNTVCNYPTCRQSFVKTFTAKNLFWQCNLTFNSDQWRGDLIAGSLQKAGSNSFF